MAGRSTYSDDDKAAVIAAYHANGGNLLRTAKETGVSRNTIRHWLEDSPPPSEKVEVALGAFVSSATAIRDRALARLKEAIEDPDIKPRDLIVILGVLDDKITRAVGLPTSRTEHTNALPDRETLRGVLTEFVQVAQEAADQRDADIVDADYVAVPPLRALPSAREQA